jgi:hypothetical protein
MTAQPIEPAEPEGAHQDPVAMVPAPRRPMRPADAIEDDAVTRLVASWPPLDADTLAALDQIING